MKSHARVAVIGGGILGASTLYHLTRLGWTDVVLIEKAELTAPMPGEWTMPAPRAREAATPEDGQEAMPDEDSSDE